MCTKPITLKNKSSPFKSVHSIQVPCGKCLECLQAYQNSWFVRFYYELISTDKAVFFTLTYNDDSVPTLVDKNGEVFKTVYKPHVQLWLKRLRTRLNHKFKYFITSEYGPKTLRPHYHGLFFGLSLDDINSSLIDWQEKFGFVQARDVVLSDSSNVVNSSRYIAKYCSKLELENYLSGSQVLPTFHLISKGLGESFVFNSKDFILRNKDIEQILQRSKININGFNYSMPKYYKDKIFGQKNLLRVRMSDYLVHRNDALYLDKLSQLQAENPNDSPYRILDLQDRHDTTSKNEKLAQRQVSFYNKSKL